VHGAWTEFERASLKTLSGLHEAAFDGPTDLPFKPVLGVFTSGTMSASPRLVLYSKANLRAALEGIYSLFDSSRIEHVFCYPQAFHTFGLTLGYLSSVLYGWELHTPRGKYGRASHDERLALKDENLLTLGTPTHFYDLLQIVRGGREIAPSYSAIVGGAGVSRDLWRAIRSDLKIEAPSIGYGCTEAAPGISHLAPGVEPSRDNEIGRPLNSISPSLTSEGVEIAGASLCRAIIQNGKIEFPEKVVIRDQVEGGDSWTFNGRLDLTLNRGGQKFSLEAIEKVLQESLRADVVAAAVSDTRLGEDLGLAVITPGSREKFLALAQDLLMREFSLKVTPEKIVFVDEFPLNECSKLDRKATQRQIEAAR
jgi:acyl-CoA synthetase (AMP-forming)/AMP-acid ligase II